MTYLKKSITKKGWWSNIGVGSEFKPQYCKNKKKKDTENVVLFYNDSESIVLLSPLL
jgi:hypothetical protein